MARTVKMLSAMFALTAGIVVGAPNCFADEVKSMESSTTTQVAPAPIEEVKHSSSTSSVSGPGGSMTSQTSTTKSAVKEAAPIVKSSSTTVKESSVTP